MKRRADFLAAASGAKVQTGPFLVQARDRRDRGLPRVGFTVMKRTGSAVERNRIRRRLRAAANEVIPRAGQAGFDYVLIARRQALTAPFDAVRNDLERALGRLHGSGSSPRRRQGSSGQADG